MNFSLHCKGAILKANFFAAHTVNWQTQCPPPREYKTTVLRHYDQVAPSLKTIDS